MASKLRVLIVDDSALVRQALSDLVAAEEGMEVMACASDPLVAAQRLREETPDVIILDIEMPRMDGLTFLQKLMSQHPLPVVICSSLAETGSATVLKALDYGAVEIIQKPRLGSKQFFEEARVRICDALRAAAATTPQRLLRTGDAQPKHNADAVLPAGANRAMLRTTERIVVIGASTGGTEALKVLLQAMPEDTPGIVIVQHMPEKFTAAFAQRLNSICAMEVKEAAQGDGVIRGRALIAPGNQHTLLKRSGARYYTEVKNGPLVSRHRPSVDVLFRSAARYAGKNAVGIILTGMGDDGASGMQEMHNQGAKTIAQDEASCVVFGMPQEAIKRQAVDYVLSLEQIPSRILQLCVQ